MNAWWRLLTITTTITVFNTAKRIITEDILFRIYHYGFILQRLEKDAAVSFGSKDRWFDPQLFQFRCQSILGEILNAKLLPSVCKVALCVCE